MHPSLRVYIQYTGLCDGINWLHNNHTQYKIVYNKQSKYDRQCYEQICLTEMPPEGGIFLYPGEDDYAIVSASSSSSPSCAPVGTKPMD